MIIMVLILWQNWNCNVFIFIVLLGGAGGKGVWGKLGDESDLDAAIDMKDPNYDSDLLDDDNIVLREITPESSDEELKVIIQYFTYKYTSTF